MFQLAIIIRLRPCGIRRPVFAERKYFVYWLWYRKAKPHMEDWLRTLYSIFLLLVTHVVWFVFYSD